MNLDNFREYCLAKPGVTEDYPFNGECAWLKVGGKVFAIVNITDMKMAGEVVPPFHFTNLKCDPDKAIELREEHDAIQPGWHMSKKNWNTVYFDNSLKDSFLKELIDHSYHEVFEGLSQKIKEQIQPS